MSWAKLDDQYPDHPKIRAVGAVGLAIQTAAICYCARYLTDGFLSFSTVDSLIAAVLAPVTDPKGAIWECAITSRMSGYDAEDIDWKICLVDAGLWDKCDGGFRVHDYLQYNPSRAQVLAERESHAKEMRQWRDKKRVNNSLRTHNRLTERSVNLFPSPSPSPYNEKVKKSIKEPPLPPNGENGFRLFWKTYPKKKSKGDAEKAWNILKPTKDLIATILDAIDRAKASIDWRKDGGQFIPFPATWLRRKGWEDEEFCPLNPPQQPGEFDHLPTIDFECWICGCRKDQPETCKLKWHGMTADQYAEGAWRHPRQEEVHHASQ